MDDGMRLERGSPGLLLFLPKPATVLLRFALASGEEVTRGLDGSLDDFGRQLQSLREPRQGPPALRAIDDPLTQCRDPSCGFGGVLVPAETEAESLGVQSQLSHTDFDEIAQGRRGRHEKALHSREGWRSRRLPRLLGHIPASGRPPCREG